MYCTCFIFISYVHLLPIHVRICLSLTYILLLTHRPHFHWMCVWPADATAYTSYLYLPSHTSKTPFIKLKQVLLPNRSVLRRSHYILSPLPFISPRLPFMSHLSLPPLPLFASLRATISIHYLTLVPLSPRPSIHTFLSEHVGKRRPVRGLVLAVGGKDSKRNEIIWFKLACVLVRLPFVLFLLRGLVAVLAALRWKGYACVVIVGVIWSGYEIDSFLFFPFLGNVNGSPVAMLIVSIWWAENSL